MTQTQSRKKNLFQMNVDLMHGPIFRSLVLFMLPILISNLSSSCTTPWTP